MYYLGIDGGGTKTAFEVIDDTGKILSSLKTPTCNYIQIGKEVFAKVIHDGAVKVCNKAGIKLSDIHCSCVGIPSFGEIAADTPDLVRMAKEALGENVYCVNDVVVAWAGSLACKPGINLLAGTGSLAYGVDTLGNTMRVGGWGYYCGDEGSAHWLGKKTIEIFTKEADGRLNKGPLYHIIRNEFHFENDFDFISVIYDQLKFQRDKIAKLQILLNKAAEEGDIYAIDAYKQASYELGLMVKTIINNLDFNSEDTVNVSYSGGVFKAKDYIFKPLEEYLSDCNYKIIRPLLIPVTGAALYAFKNGGGKNVDSVIERLSKEDGEY